MQCDSQKARDLKLSVIREPAYTPMTPRKRKVCWDFGIPAREKPFTIAEDLRIALRPGGIVMLAGPSGGGKTSVLHAIAEQAERVVWVGRGRVSTQRPVVDTIAPNKPLATALEILTACGLGEPRLWVRRFDDLSDGERFRARLARAIGQAISGSARHPILCDEFTAILHRRAAKAIAYNLRKLVSRHRLTLVVATTHDDIIADLQPDKLVRLGTSEPETIHHTPRETSMSLRRHATVVPGLVADYRIFGPMHYRHRDGLGFVDKVFVLKESPRGEPIGILVFAHAPLELALRNQSTERRFVRNPRRLNRELRILRRLVMHPDVRGCGLGHWFVEKTLPLVGVRFIECLAAMGAVNPVFEKAGMRRVGRCPLPRGRMAMLERMRKWHIDPFAVDFPRRIARYPRVRKLVEQTIRDWAASTQGSHKYRIDGRPAEALASTFRQIIGEPPMYYLWDQQGVFPRVNEPSSDKVDHHPGRRQCRDGDADVIETRTARSAKRRSPEGPADDRSV